MVDAQEDRKAKVLPLSCMTAGGDAFVVHFPLHALTRSPEHVGRLGDALLETVTQFVEGGDDVGNGDVLQALAIALAVRARVVDAPPGTTERLTRDLVETALAAAAAAKPVDVGQA